MKKLSLIVLMNALKCELAYSQKQTVITLIEKKGKDRVFLKNWQPISLSNIDFKFMSKVINTKIKDVLHPIVHHNQTIKDYLIS